MNYFVYSIFFLQLHNAVYSITFYFILFFNLIFVALLWLHSCSNSLTLSVCCVVLPVVLEHSCFNTWRATTFHLGWKSDWAIGNYWRWNPATWTGHLTCSKYPKPQNQGTKCQSKEIRYNGAWRNLNKTVLKFNVISRTFKDNGF